MKREILLTGSLRKLLTLSLIFICSLLTWLPVTAQTTTFDVNGIPKVYVNLLQPGPITQDSDLEAHIQLVNGSGSTYTSDALYNGLTTIHGHGNSTWKYPQKSYNISLKDGGWNDFDFGMLGMPADNSWILLANYDDRTIMHDALAYYLGYAIGMEWSPRYRYVELYLDSSYQGLYMLVEKISHATNRVNIQKLSNDSLSQTYPNITGGYIIEVTPPIRVTTDDSFFVTKKTKKTFVVDYPKSENLAKSEVAYIHQYTDSFETALFGTKFKDTAVGYAHYIDVSTFVDWYIIEELAKNQDSKLYASCFFYKDRLGKLKAGPIWDFDRSWGNRPPDIDSNREDGFLVQAGPYYAQLFKDTAFAGKVQRRWSQVRHIFDSISALIATASSELVQTGAIDRNFAQWPIFGVNLGVGSPPFPSKYSGEITHFSDQANQRMKWLNIYLQTTQQAQCDSIKTTKPVISIIGTDQHDGMQPFEVRTLRGFSQYYWNNTPTKSYDTTISTFGKYWLQMSVNGCTTLVSDTLYFGVHYLDTPVCTAATQATLNSFVSNWNSVNHATGYQLDVSTSPAFSTSTSTTVTEGFNNGLTPPPGWIFKGMVIDTVKYGIAPPSLKFNQTGRSVTTATYPAPATQLSFFIRAIQTSPGSLLLEGSDGATWKTIENITNIAKANVTKTYNAASPGWQNNFVRFRFTYTKTGGATDLDDVSVTYGVTTPSYVPGYNHLAVNGTSQLVNGLNPNTTYYYRVRATTSNDSSAFSNVISATTCSSTSVTISNITVTNVGCNGASTGEINVTATGNNLAYQWTGPNNFTSTSSDITNLPAGSYNLVVTSNGGCGLDTTVVVTQPVALTATTSAPAITCSGDTTTVTVNATGGTGNYSYTLSDGTNTQGPQSDNHFTITAGSYTITVTDGNSCTYDTSIIINDGAPCGSGFTAGNLVVLQTTGTVSKASSPITLDEFTTGGTAGISVPLPVTGATPVQTSGVFGGSEGFLTTSTDSKYLVLGGYGTSASFTDITATASSSVPRVIGKVLPSGAYHQVSSSSTAYSGNDIRGAISDGTNYWASGASSANVDGIDYYGPGAFAGLGTAATPPKAYGLHIFNGQIYYSTEKSGPNNTSSQLGIFALGTGLPTTNPVTITQVINTTTSSLEDFSFNSDISVCYIASNSNSATGGIQKWTNSGGGWTLAYTLGTGATNIGAYGLVVDYSGANPVIYATTTETTGNRVITITDAGAGSTATTIVAAQSGVFYKGICFAPVGSSTFAEGNGKTSANFSSKTISGGLNVHVFPNPSVNEFTLTVESRSNEKVEVIAADVYGKKVYQASGSGNSNYSFGKNFSSGTYFIKVIQGGNIKTLKLIKQE
jgi:hypothetical protein